MPETVIVPRRQKGGRKVYHTDVCRTVWQIDDKRYMTRRDAEVWNYEKCTYCAGEFTPEHGSGCATRSDLLQHNPDECRECGRPLGAGYLCDDCDTVAGWPDE